MLAGNLAAFTLPGVAGAVAAALRAAGAPVALEDPRRLRAALSAERARSARLSETLAAERRAARRVARRVAARTAAGAARRLASVPARSLPVVGAAATVAGAAWETAEACATLADLAPLAGGALGPEAAAAGRLCARLP
jgi:hypothetical protein